MTTPTIALCAISAAISAALLLAGCSYAVEPGDAEVAVELCAKRGGYTSIASSEYGKNLRIECKDGLRIEAWLHRIEPK